MPWPAHLSVSNFTSVFTEQPFARWLLNSVIVATATTILGVFLSSPRRMRSRVSFSGPRPADVVPRLADVPGTLMLIRSTSSSFSGSASARTLSASSSCTPSRRSLSACGCSRVLRHDSEGAGGIGPDGWARRRRSSTESCCRSPSPRGGDGAVLVHGRVNEFIQAATFMDKATMYTAPVGCASSSGASRSSGYFAAGPSSRRYRSSCCSSSCRST